MIVDFMILHHVEGWRRFLDEAFRVLRPGGEMYINDLMRKGVHLTDFFFRWDHAEEPLFTMKEFEQQALKSGFATVKRCNYAGFDFCFKFQKAKEYALHRNSNQRTEDGPMIVLTTMKCR